MFLPDPRASYERALVATFCLLASTSLLAASVFLERVVGLPACELCLLQRWPLGVGALAAAAALAIAHNRPKSYAAAVSVAAACFAAGAAVAAYHSGVEAGLWTGPASCSHAAALAAKDVGSLAAALKGARIVRCDVSAVSFLGLSLANLNVVASGALAAAAAGAAWPKARGRMLSAAGLGPAAA